MGTAQITEMGVVQPGNVKKEKQNQTRPRGFVYIIAQQVVILSFQQIQSTAK